MWRKTITIFFTILILFSGASLAQENQNPVEDLQKKIDEYTQKLFELGKAKDTLANQISIINSQIDLALLRITQTENSIKILEKEISQLTVKIEELDLSLNHLSSNYLQQITQNYKLQRRIPINLLFFSPNINYFLTRYKYLTAIQKNSQNTLLDMETVRTNFDFQKSQKTKKQKELEDLQVKLNDQKISLAKQKTAKSNLLETTKNDEARYQKLREDAEKELNSLLAAKFVGKKSIKKGEAIGIMGNTGYSFGDHLHFGLYELSEKDVDNWSYQNDIDATEYLAKNIWPMDGISSIDQTCDANNSGNCITQKRGHTKYSYLYGDRFHHGLDMVSANKVVKAVNDGVAYVYRNSSSSLGNHVKLFHPDGKMTLYLHLQ